MGGSDEAGVIDYIIIIIIITGKWDWVADRQLRCGAGGVLFVGVDSTNYIILPYNYRGNVLINLRIVKQVFVDVSYG